MIVTDLDILEVLARLQPTTVRFDIGNGGGKAGLTPQDFSAALAWVKDPLGENLLFLRAGAGDARCRHRALSVIATRQHAEFDRQTRAEQIARTNLRIAADHVNSIRAPSAPDRQALAAAKSDHDRAKAACWPHEHTVLPALRVAVLTEVCEPRECPICKGRMVVADGEKVSDCQACEARGFLYLRDAERAELIDRDPANFNRTWRPVYNWTLALVQDAFFTALGQFRAALGHGKPISS